MKLCARALSSVLLAKGLATVSALSPVTRVVELLQGLSQKVENDLKQEEDLFESFECWAKSVVSQKTGSNEAATARKESLQTYAADLDAGRIELTTERVDLEKEISGLSSDIEQADALRSKEKADYEAAKQEMDQAVAALKEAIDVLGGGEKPASLLRLRGGSGGQESLSSRLADGQAVSLVMRLAHDSMSKADSTFLRRVLTADVPTKDWKKLNRKADFKMKYESRSGEIQKTLKSLLETFESNLKDATDKETKAVNLHSTLMDSKNGQLGHAQDALSSMAVEGAARGLSKSEAEAEIEALTAQVEADTKFIEDTKAAMQTKKGEWKDRKQIRTDEISAISQAISILHADDARDLFKRSISSQGYLFVQVKSATRRVIAMHKAKLVALASGHFDKVTEAIDKMVTNLESEEAEDLKKKEGCEKARAEDTRQAITLSRTMDELSDAVERLKSEVEQLEAEVKQKQEEIVNIGEELKEAKRLREDEHTEWKASDADDKAAAELVGQAIGVLQTFYSSKFVQTSAAVRQPVEGMKAGEAPPPPPSTWEAPYRGAQDQNTGIVAIMGMVKSDIEEDRTKAKTEEDSAKQAYGTFKAENEQQIQDLQTAISEMQGTIADKETEVQDTERDRLAKRGELETVMKNIKDAAPGCDYFVVNYHMRVENRQTELDGLKQAKQVLQGASFGK